MSDEIKQDLNVKQNQSISQEPYQSTSSSYTQEYETMGDFILDTRNLDHQEINTDKFKKGIDLYSEIAGKMSVLTSMGIESKIALEFIERELIREHEIKLIKQK